MNAPLASLHVMHDLAATEASGAARADFLSSVSGDVREPLSAWRLRVQCVAGLLSRGIERVPPGTIARLAGGSPSR